MKQIRLIAIAFAFIFAIVGYVSVSAGSLPAPAEDAAVEIDQTVPATAEVSAVLIAKLTPESSPAESARINGRVRASSDRSNYQDWIAEVPTPPNELENASKAQPLKLAFNATINVRAREKI